MESNKLENSRHSDVYCFAQHDDGCFNCMAGGIFVYQQYLA